MKVSRPPLELMLMLCSLGVLIFFTPWVFQQNPRAHHEAVKQNMRFLQEIVLKYHEENGTYPVDLNDLVKEARAKRYNKTLFNPLLKHAGDLNNNQIVSLYPENLLSSLGPEFESSLYIGKTGYFSNGAKYLIYGHLQSGKLLQENGQALMMGNF